MLAICSQFKNDNNAFQNPFVLTLSSIISIVNIAIKFTFAQFES